MAWQNLREEIEELFGSLPTDTRPRPWDGFAIKRPNDASHMREWRRLNPEKARAAIIRQNARKRETRIRKPRQHKSSVDTLEMLRLLHQGLTGKEAAAQMGVSGAALSRARTKAGLGAKPGSNQFLRKGT